LHVPLVCSSPEKPVALEDLGLVDQVPNPDDPSVDFVTTVFKWTRGGNEVYIAGTFNGWKKKLPMHRSGHDFTYIADLPRGKHAYRFLVDSEWRFDPELTKAKDRKGRVHNVVDLADFKSHDEKERERKNTMERSGTVCPGNYGFIMPDVYDYGNEPPQLPPHLRHIILNNQPQDLDNQNPRALPKPQTVTLNHLYCTAVKHGLMVLGTSCRYKRKFVTTVYYSKAQFG